MPDPLLLSNSTKDPLPLKGVTGGEGEGGGRGRGVLTVFNKEGWLLNGPIQIGRPCVNCTGQKRNNCITLVTFSLNRDV